MKHLLLRGLITALVAVTVVSPASASVVLTFDDLQNSQGFGPVSSPYAGFTFNGWWHIDNPPNPYPTASSPTVIYNSESPYTNSPEILFGTSLDVLSVYLADFSSDTVTLFGYSGATQLYSSTIDITEAMVKYNVNFLGIDKFVMQTTPGVTNAFAFLDNLEYANGSAVPEPGSIGLVGLAMLGAVTIRRRKKVSS